MITYWGKEQGEGTTIGAKFSKYIFLCGFAFGIR